MSVTRLERVAPSIAWTRDLSDAVTELDLKPWPARYVPAFNAGLNFGRIMNSSLTGVYGPFAHDQVSKFRNL